MTRCEHCGFADGHHDSCVEVSDYTDAERSEWLRGYWAYCNTGFSNALVYTPWEEYLAQLKEAERNGNMIFLKGVECCEQRYLAVD
jgi:hypothetical protein